MTEQVSVEEFNKMFGKGDGPDAGGDDKAADAKDEKKPAKGKGKKKSDE